MNKLSHSTELTILLDRLKEDKSAPPEAIRELSPEERDIYLDELTKRSLKNRDKLMKMINNKES